MDIEKLAHSVFENAEQEPPREVWSEIESRLRSSAAPKARRHWQWAAGAGAFVIVAAAVIVAITRMQPAEPQTQLAFVDTAIAVENNAAMKIVSVSEAADNLATETKSRPMGVAQQAGTENMSVAGVANPQKRTESRSVSASSPSVKEDEPIFDLLEYQLNSHEYDIPAETQSTTQPALQKESKRQIASVKKDDGQPARGKDTAIVDIFIPNILSPNGDGYNDCWSIPDLAKYGRASVRVYTSQSKRVFASDDYRGDFCGDNLPSGNYFYEIKLQSCNHVRRGVLVIKR